VSFDYSRAVGSSLARAEKDATRAGILRQFEAQEETLATTPDDLKSMSDEEIDRLYHGTLKKIVQDSRRR
jgi:hypothetical protein